jgi:hypothetical protein
VTGQLFGETLQSMRELSGQSGQQSSQLSNQTCSITATRVISGASPLSTRICALQLRSAFGRAAEGERGIEVSEETPASALRLLSALLGRV